MTRFDERQDGSRRDVLIIGAGAGGLAAAIAAHDAGASVAIVEKMDRPGGNSALSTGSVPAAASRFQREAASRISPNNSTKTCFEVSGGPSDCPELVRRWTRPPPKRSSGLSIASVPAWRCHFCLQAYRPHEAAASCANVPSRAGSRQRSGRGRGKARHSDRGRQSRSKR